MEGLIIKSISGQYTVKLDNCEIVTVKPIGLFRHKNINLLVGDRVEVTSGVITEVKARKNSLLRPTISNVDKVFIVTSFIEPGLNLNLLDRIISEVEYANIEIVLVFSKTDLIELEKFNQVCNYYRGLGYKVYLSPNDFEEIKLEINDSICVVAGQSGVGKSTLINLFDDFKIKTDNISKALGRGKHTTRFTQLLEVGTGYIADTPGFGTVELQMDVVTLSQTFREFFNTKCKFNGCTHLNEPGCMVKNKVENNIILKSRYENYKLFATEIQNKKPRY